MKKVLLVSLSFLGIFLLFFTQFPLQDSLSGDLDTLCNLSMYKEMQLYFQCLFTGQEYTAICYPAENSWMYMGADFGIGIIHLFFNAIGFNDIWANALFLSVLFTLNSIALYLLLSHLFRSNVIGAFGSLIFNLSHFALGNLENPNTLVFFFSFYSIYLVFKYFDADKPSLAMLLGSSVIGGIQIYFAPYNFLFHCFILLCAYVFFLYSKNYKVKWTDLLSVAVIYAVLILPYAFMFIFGDDIDNSYNVIKEQNLVNVLSLSIDDYARVLGNHLYFDNLVIPGDTWTLKIKSAYLGLVFYAFVIYGVLLRSKLRLFAILLIITGIILATGPHLCYKTQPLIPSVMYPFYEYMGMGDILRIPSRAFFISIFGFVILICTGLQNIQNKYRSIWPLVVILLLILLENVPFKMDTYKNDLDNGCDVTFVTAIEEKQPELILNLPSEIFTSGGDRREYLYMYWHHLYNTNMINGLLGFMPPERMATDAYIRQNDPIALNSLIIDYSIEKVVFHKDLVLREEENILLEHMETSSDFHMAYQSASKVIFETTSLLDDHLKPE